MKRYPFSLIAHATILRAVFKDAVGVAAVAAFSCRIGSRK